MKIYAQEIFKRNIQFILFLALSLLCLVSIILSFKNLKQMREPILIAIDSNGTRVVSQATDPIYKTEASAFLNKFAMNIYNFDSNNFMQKVGVATSLMSESLWKEKKSSILDLKNKVERDEVQIIGLVQKITKDDSGLYHLLVNVTEKSRLNKIDRILQIAVRLRPVARTNENPWGLEVNSYEESIIHN